VQEVLEEKIKNSKEEMAAKDWKLELLRRECAAIQAEA
jgi:hypothetical protein